MSQQPTTQTTARNSFYHQQYRDPSIQQQIHTTPTAVASNRPRKSSTNSNTISQLAPTAVMGTTANNANSDVPSYMRSTSASTKKSLSSVPITASTQQYSHPQLSGHLANRHLANRSMMGQAQSTSDLRQVVKDEDSSSDDDTSSLNPSRRRSSSHDR